MKPTPRVRDLLEIMEVIKFTSSFNDSARILTTLVQDQMGSNTDMDDDTLISHHMIPMTIPIEQVMHSLECKRSLVNLPESGCTRCLVSPGLVKQVYDSESS